MWYASVIDAVRPFREIESGSPEDDSAADIRTPHDFTTTVGLAVLQRVGFVKLKVGDSVRVRR